VARSLTLAATVTAASVLLGLLFAFLVVRTDLPGRKVVGVLAALPLAIPSYIAAFAWVSSPGRRERVPRGLPRPHRELLPLCLPPVVAAMRGIDPATEEVARGLGKTPWQAFWSVTARQVRPAAAGGALLAALYTLSDFGAVSLLRYDVFTRVIHTSYRSSFDRTPAHPVPPARPAHRDHHGERVATRAASEQVRVGGGAARRPSDDPARPLVLARRPGRDVTVLGLALAFPIVSLAYWSATGLSRGVEVARLVESTMRRPRGSPSSGRWPASFSPSRSASSPHVTDSGRIRLIEHATFAGHALPGIVVALALVFFGIRFATPIYQQTPMLVLAYAVLFLPAAVIAVRSSVAMSSPRIEEVARSLGKTRGEVLRQVTLPLAAPGIAAGAALVLLTAMKELPATLLLQPTGSRTLATSLWTETGVAAYAAAAPYGLALVVLAVLPTLVLMRVQAGR
jgi:iron(III) transport system permease protein